MLLATNAKLYDSFRILTIALIACLFKLTSDCHACILQSFTFCEICEIIELKCCEVQWQWAEKDITGNLDKL